MPEAMAQKRKVLVLDSSKTSSSAIQHALNDQRIWVEIEKRADQALLKIINWSPDLLITSIELGFINGFDLCLILRMMPDFASMPIILISSHQEGVILPRAAQIGADFYVQKDANLLNNIRQKVDQLFFAQVPSHRRGVKRPIESVLLVDDSKVMRTLIRNILFKLGVPHIEEAENGREGLERLGEKSFSMVISDMNMPEMDGMAFAKNIRRNPQYDHIYFVLVSAGGVDNLEHAVKMGADDYLDKPFSVNSLKDLVLKFTTLNEDHSA